jgi:signal transduction histidine kinase
MLGRVLALMVRLRYLALVGAGLVVTFVPLAVLEGAQPVVYGVLLAGLVYNTLLALALRLAPRERRPAVAVASVVIDTLLISIIVAQTDGIRSPFFGAYLGVGIVAGIYGGMRGALLATLFYTICFAVASRLAIGYTPWYVSIYVHFVLRVAFAAAVSLFAGLLSGELEKLATTNEELKRLNRLLHLRSTVSEITNATSEPADLLLLVAKRIREELEGTECRVIVTRPAAAALMLQARGDEATIIVADPEEVAERYPVAVQAISERRPIRSGDALPDGNPVPEGMLCVPLLGEERVLGALLLAAADEEGGALPAGFDDDDVKEVTVIAGQLAIKLENTLLMADLNRSYLELRQVDQLKSSILANTSHELRTPLTLILGYAEALLGGLGGALSAEQTTFAAGIRQSGKRLLGLVDNLLTVASMEKGPIPLQLQPIDLERQLDYALTAVQPAIMAKGLRVERRASLGARWVLADQQSLRQILAHLLKNALEFSPHGATVTMEALAEDEDGLIQVRVSDAGSGMTKEQVASLFTMFHQVDGSSRRSHEGIGLGLYICKRLVEAHGGTIWVQSEPERGSTFCFTLRRAAAPTAAAVEPEAVAAGH